MASSCNSARTLPLPNLRANRRRVQLSPNAVGRAAEERKPAAHAPRPGRLTGSGPAILPGGGSRREGGGNWGAQESGERQIVVVVDASSPGRQYHGRIRVRARPRGIADACLPAVSGLGHRDWHDCCTRMTQARTQAPRPSRLRVRFTVPGHCTASLSLYWLEAGSCTCWCVAHLNIPIRTQSPTGARRLGVQPYPAGFNS